MLHLARSTSYEAYHHQVCSSFLPLPPPQVYSPHLPLHKHPQSYVLPLLRNEVPHNPTKSYPITGLDRPLGLQEVEASRISRHSAHEGSKVVSPTHRPPLPQRKYTWYSFMLEAELTLGP
jgi:hypothetical protein